MIFKFKNPEKVGTNQYHDILKHYYHEPHRYYHNMEHILRMRQVLPKIRPLDVEEYTLLSIAIELHDIFYDPRRTDNEEISAEFVDPMCENLDDEYRERIKNLILDTKPSAYAGESRDDLTPVLRLIDCYDMITENERAMHENNSNILKEFQYLNYNVYCENRHKFIDEFMKDTLDLSKKVIEREHNFLNYYRPNIGVYAGSFNPFHSGHMSVLNQAEKLFDKIIIATPGRESNKDFPQYRVHDLQHSVLPFHEVATFDGALVDYLARVQRYANVTLIRGLRNGNDLDYEVNMKEVNKDIAGHDYPTVYFVTDQPHVSSTVVRSLIEDKIYNPYAVHKYDYAKYPELVT